jgi:uncharacterized protein (DUF433 family)/DNA-binding transcriptional MerR regulator
MAEARGDLLAIPDKRAAKLARITMRQLRYWEQTSLIVPSIERQISPRNTVRLYNYQDLLGLLVAAELRNRVSLQHIRRVVAQLRDRGFADPLRELRFATHGNDVYFQYPDGSWSGDPRPDQVVFHQVIALDALRAKIPSVSERDPNASGKVVRRRGVLGGKPIFAGTRIPVAVVQRYLQAGYGTDAIIEEYPSLTPADIEAARKYAPDASTRKVPHPVPGSAAG